MTSRLPNISDTVGYITDPSSLGHLDRISISIYDWSMRKAVKEKDTQRPKLLRRAKEFDDKEREAFIQAKVKKYSKHKNWIRFTWPQLVRFFGLRNAFDITNALGGKFFYPAVSSYKEREGEEGHKSKWLKVNRASLKKLMEKEAGQEIAEEVTKLIYKYFKQTYVYIPAKRLFWTTEYISFGQIPRKVKDRLQGIDKRLKEGVAKSDVAKMFEISPQQLSYYIKKYQLG